MDIGITCQQKSLEKLPSVRLRLWDFEVYLLEIAGHNVTKIKQDLLYESESSMIIISNNRK
jgi:hypothetical protein